MVRIAILLLCLMPVAVGLLGAILPALGWFPPLGEYHFSFQPFVNFFAQPGLRRSLYLSLSVGLLATFLSYWLAMFLLAILYGQGCARFLFRLISPLLSVPHITIAVGFLFLLQPSGWLSRLFSPWLTGWQRPPNLNIVPDENAFVLVLALIAKELPFLLLMGLSALSQIKVRPLLDTAASLGYGPLAGWMHLVQPQLAARLRLAVLIVMVFSISVVDMAILLAPSTPAPLAVRILTWFRDPDLSYQFIAAAAAVMQLACALLACVIWVGTDKAILFLIARLSAAGQRFSRLPSSFVSALKKGGVIVAVWPCAMACFGMLAALIWAFADIWRYPSALPDEWGLNAWKYAYISLGQATLNSLVLGLVTAAICVSLALLWLQTETAKGDKHAERLIYIPLLLPQIAFLFGMQILLIWLGFDGFFLALLWAHSLFVFPYVMLSLAPTWRRFDARYLAIAATLGAGPLRRFLAIKLAMMTLPVLTAFAVGFAVSSALYLPTIFASNGRVMTLTTEAVTLAAGAGRQNLGIASLMQMALPLCVFLICDRVARVRLARFSFFKL